ncbi:hypothetical protein [Syntrophorhabdus aromaticivorans]|jgi:hypothetical protein|uniref:Uncharacterized protein n=1 Tax=Syntrophorhabdus aromaticivorans TaxID=328301 RepID=A0A971M519_9BACT|nr:hypothetical protein [Syntrophorhabdus aromaticivorans]NLW35527.1 hypothetical protein [Syntrophorhabdus aromaticivorans]
MAEIKSAIELAMEKTKDLVVGGEERRTIATREAESKVKAVVRRYLGDMTSQEDAAREFDEIDADRRLKGSVLVETLVEEFDVKKSPERLLALFGLTGIDLEGSLRNEFATLQGQFQEEMARKEKTIRGKISDSLAFLGITGTGIEPNLAAWDEWTEGAEEAGSIFKQRIQEWKEKVRASSSRL